MDTSQNSTFNWDICNKNLLAFPFSFEPPSPQDAEHKVLNPVKSLSFVIMGCALFGSAGLVIYSFMLWVGKKNVSGSKLDLISWR